MHAPATARAAYRRPPPPPTAVAPRRPRRRARRAAAAALPTPPPAPPPPPLPAESDDVAPYGEYAWVRRAATGSNTTRQRLLLPHLSAENAFAAAALLQQQGGGQQGPHSSLADSLAQELREWSLAAAVGGLEEDEQERGTTTTTAPDAPPLASANTAATTTAALCGRPPLRGKRARRRLTQSVGEACVSALFDPDAPALRDAELSPCGRFVAALQRRQRPPPDDGEEDGNDESAFCVCVLCAETGAEVARVDAGGRTEPLDLPLEWASPGWGGGEGGDGRQHLFFLAADSAAAERGRLLTVECLSFSSSGQSDAAASTALRLPARGWAGATICRPSDGGSSPLFAVGWAPDGAPVASFLIAPPETGRARQVPELDGGQRCALSVWGGGGGNDNSSRVWVVARLWGGDGGGAQLLLGRVSPSGCHDEWQCLPLAGALEERETLEAVFLPPPPGSDGEGGGGDQPPPYLVTLSVRSRGLSSELVARRLDLAVVERDSVTSFELVLRAEARAGPAALDGPSLAAATPVPPPHIPALQQSSAWQPAGAGSWTLANAVWDAQKQELRMDASAMGCPPRRLALRLAGGGDGWPPVVLASAATPQWWAEAAASRAWPRLWRTVALSPEDGGGARVPVTVLLPSAAGDPSAPPPPFPLLLHVYGAYGARDPSMRFDPLHEALARRGWAVAVAHVRGGAAVAGAALAGGQEAPSTAAWHEAGRSAERKRVGVEDVISAARHLVLQGVADPQRLCLAAQSAGAWVAVPAAAGGAAGDDPPVAAASTLSVLALLLTVPALCPSDESRAQQQQEHARGAGLLGRAAAADDEAELGVLAAEGGNGGWDPYACCSAALARSCSPRVLLRTALDDRVVGFWEAMCFAARVRRLREEVEAGSGDREAAGATPSSVLLRTVPRGGHKAFSGGDNVGEEVLALVFLLTAV